MAHVFKTATVMYPAAWSKEMVTLIKKVRAAVEADSLGAWMFYSWKPARMS